MYFLFCGTSVLISSPILRISKFEVRRHRIRRNNEGLNWWQWCNVRFALFDTTMAFRTRVWWFKLRVFDMPFNSTNFSLICGFSCSKLGSFVAVWSLGFWCEEHMGFRFALCVLFCCWISNEWEMVDWWWPCGNFLGEEGLCCDWFRWVAKKD